METKPALAGSTPTATPVKLHKRSLLVGAGIGFGLALLLAILVGFLLTGGIPIGTEGITPGQPAPDFTALDLQGNAVQLSSYRGQPVVLTFWTPECSTCLENILLLQKLVQEQNVAITPLTIASHASTDAIATFVKEQQLQLPALLDEDGAVMSKYKIEIIPFTYFINPAGVVDEVVIGWDGSMAFQQTLDSWLAACRQQQLCQ